MIHQRGCQDGLAIVMDTLKETKEIVQGHTWVNLISFNTIILLLLPTPELLLYISEVIFFCLY